MSKTYTLRKKSEEVVKHEVTNCGLFSVYRWYGGTAIVVINDHRMEDIIWRNDEAGWSVEKYAEEFPDVHGFLSLIHAAKLDHERVIEVLSDFFKGLTHYHKEAITK